jgi:hypothetical protein
MNAQSQSAVQERAQVFCETLVESYRALIPEDSGSDRADPELTQRFCLEVIRYLDALTVTQWEAGRANPESEEAVEHPSVGACMTFLDQLLGAYNHPSDLAVAPSGEE